MDRAGGKVMAALALARSVGVGGASARPSKSDATAPGIGSPAPVIRGIAADPREKETGWDEDFAFSDGEDDVFDSPKDLTSKGLPKAFLKATPTEERRSVRDVWLGVAALSSTTLGSFRELLPLMPLGQFRCDETPQKLKDTPKKRKDNDTPKSGKKSQSRFVEMELPEWRSSSMNFAETVESYEWKLDVAKQRRDPLEQSAALLGLGRTIRKDGQNAKALSVLEEALQTLAECEEDHKDTPSAVQPSMTASSPEPLKAEVFLELGKTAVSEDRTDSARSYLLEALKLSERQGTSLVISRILYELGMLLGGGDTHDRMVAAEYYGRYLRVYLRLHLEEESEESGTTVLDPERVDWRKVGHACLAIGRCVFESSNTAENQDLAAQFLERAMYSGRRAGEDGTTASAQRYLSKVSRAKLEAEEESEVEDWDLELELDGNDSPQSGKPKGALADLSGALSSSMDFTTGDEVPAGNKILPMLENTSRTGVIHVIKYPKPTMLYSMRTKEGRKMLGEMQLEEWLNQLSLHGPLWRELDPGVSKKSEESACSDPAAPRVSDGQAVPDWRSALSERLKCMTLFTVPWMEAYLVAVRQSFYQKESGLVWEVIRQYFTELAGYPRERKIDEDEHGEELYYGSSRLLQIAARLPEAQRDAESFQDMMLAVTALGGEAESWLPKVLQAESMSHHVGVLSPVETATILPTYLSMYTRSSMTEYLNATSQEKARLASVIMLCDVYLLLNKFSPLTFGALDLSVRQKGVRRESISSPAAGRMSFDGGSESDDEDNHVYSMLMAGLEGEIRHDPDKSWVMEAESCAEKVMELYGGMKTSNYYKAKAAYVLGMYFEKDINDAATAEQLYFESLYCLDNCQYMRGAMMSSLGDNVMYAYGRVLLVNFKYKYAISSWEACLACRQFQGMDVHDLYRRMAVVSFENNDWRRAIAYYEATRAQCMRDKRTNEVVHVSGVMCNIAIERGEFIEAEAFLLSAIQYLRGMRGTDRSLTVQEAEKSMILRAGQACLEGGRYDQCLAHLETLNELSKADTFGREKVAALTMQAQAYMAKGLWEEAGMVLDIVSRSKTGGSKGRDGVLGRLGTSTVNLAAQQNTHIIELHAKNHKTAGRFREALDCIDECIMASADSGSIRSLARSLYVRGRILQSMCARPLRFKDYEISTLPHSINVGGTMGVPADESPSSSSMHRSPSGSTGSKGGATAGARKMSECFVITSEKDIVDVCVQAYMRAYNYYRVVGDERAIAKVMCRVAAVQLAGDFVTKHVLAKPADNPFHMRNCSASTFSSLVEAVGTPKEGSARDLLGLKDASPNSGKPNVAKKLMIKTHSESAHNRNFSDGSSIRSMPFSHIEDPASLALDVSLASGDMVYLLQSYLNMAELKVLQACVNRGIAYWKECRDLFFHLFVVNTSVPLVKRAPQGFVRQLYHVLKRMVRFLFGLGADLLSSNVRILDVLVAFEADMHRYTSTYTHSVDTKASEVGGSSSGVGQRGSGAFETFPPTARHARSHSVASSHVGSLSRPLSNRSFADLLSSGGELSTSPSVGSLSGREEDDVASACDDNGSREVEQLWGGLHILHVHLGRFSRGEWSLDNLRNQNIEILREYSAYMEQTRELHGGETGAAGEGSYCYDMKRTRACSRLFAVVLVDDLIMYYNADIGDLHAGRVDGALIPEDALGILSLSLRGLGDGTVERSNDQTRSALESLKESIGLPDHLLSGMNDGDDTEKCGEREEPISRTSSSARSIFKSVVRKPTRILSGPAVSKKGSIMSFFNGSAPVPAPDNSHLTTDPVVILASHQLSAVPWELLLPRMCVRAATVASHLEVLNGKTDFGSVSGGKMPKLFAFYSSDENKSAGVADSRRKDWLVQQFVQRFSIADTKSVHPFRNTKGRSTSLFHLLLSRHGRAANSKKHYRAIKFFDREKFRTNPSNVISMLESQTSQHDHPVVLLTMADLVEASDAFQWLLSYRCTMIFISAEHIKFVAKYLISHLDVNSGPVPRSPLSVSPSMSSSSSIQTLYPSKSCETLHKSESIAESIDSSITASESEAGGRGSDEGEQTSNVMYDRIMCAVTTLQREYSLPIAVLKPPCY